jgi:hypothetical protein
MVSLVSVFCYYYIDTTIMHVTVTSFYFIFFILIVRVLTMERNTSVMLYWNLHPHWSIWDGHCWIRTVTDFRSERASLTEKCVNCRVFQTVNIYQHMSKITHLLVHSALTWRLKPNLWILWNMRCPCCLCPEIIIGLCEIVSVHMPIAGNVKSHRSLHY